MGCCLQKLNNSQNNIFDRDLEKLGPNAPKLENKSFSTQAYIVSVYDGDTFTQPSDITQKLSIQNVEF